MRAAFIRRLVVLVAVLALPASALSAEQAELVEDETEFFVHWVGCGADSDLFLSIDHPGNAANGCGWAGGAPLNAVTEATGGAATAREFPTKGDGVPLVLDADRTVTGEVRIHRWAVTGSGVGQVDVEGILTARIGNRNVELGRFREEKLANPAEPHVRFPFEITMAETHSGGAQTTGAEAVRVQLDVVVRGVHVNSGVIVTQGLSYITIPTLVPGL